MFQHLDHEDTVGSCITDRQGDRIGLDVWSMRRGDVDPQPARSRRPCFVVWSIPAATDVDHEALEPTHLRCQRGGQSRSVAGVNPPVSDLTHRPHAVDSKRGQRPTVIASGAVA